MAITFDPAKRDLTLRERGIDFAIDAAKVFAGDSATFDSEQKGHGELRQITAGWLNGRPVMMVWTARGEDQHIISMRYCHAGEAKKLRQRFNQT
ncbi:BrnT family toxin [Rhodopseudomonas palustris]|uniref:BrnT family toxin n=1 Tax=Rhodopseudomonas palustris TaxID=1076 RepID=UPI0021F28037|nr:BrnT family toxin [Rhodopseudomonas palustris]UYO52183.1 BrnT family toxin [Rhodopseudomonas palustris]